MILAPYALFVKHKMLFYQKKLRTDRYAEMCVRNSGAVRAGHFPQEHLDTAAHSHHMRQHIHVIRDRAFGSHATVHSGHTRQSWMQGSISRGTEYICVHYSGYRFAQSCGAVACLHPCRLPVRQENGFAPPAFHPCTRRIPALY